MVSGSWVPTATERNRNMSNSAMATRDAGAGPRYEVIKAYRQRGPMRQYRLTASTSFGCFRCALAKTSRLVTVFREDWNRLLCNGCYGLLISLHDLRAGSADDSERADALAEQLLALAGSTLPVSASHNSSLTGTSLLQPHAGLWEPYDGRLSRTVLREREGEVPSRHSPGLARVRLTRIAYHRNNKPNQP